MILDLLKLVIAKDTRIITFSPFRTKKGTAKHEQIKNNRR